ncbi:MAG: nucleotidyltransferase domain-containing protein [Thermoplasmata archaeon]
MFTLEYREHVRDYLLQLARSDPRIIAGAAVGSDATGNADRWSDLDLTFGVAEDSLVGTVMSDWTSDVESTFGAATLFDVSAGPTIYRVFLLPGNLQVDLSFTSGYVADYGPKFKLLFGTAVRREHSGPSSPKDGFGRGVHHAVRARYSIERGRGWQAEYWIRGVRDEAMSLACLRRGLEPSHGRGPDRLPSDVLQSASNALVRSMERAELLRALGRAIDLLCGEAWDADDLLDRLEPRLRALTRDDWS